MWTKFAGRLHLGGSRESWRLGISEGVGQRDRLERDRGRGSLRDRDNKQGDSEGEGEEEGRWKEMES